jgi:hypothetical protein
LEHQIGIRGKEKKEGTRETRETRETRGQTEKIANDK